MLPAPREPDRSEMKNPRKSRHCKWRGWVKPEIINRKRTEIESSRLKYFALFPHAYNNGWQLFELHTGKDGMADSQVATLLGHDLQAHRNWLKLMPLTKDDKFSDNTAEWVVGDPDFDPDTFLNRGLDSGEKSKEEITGDGNEERNAGDENEEENTGDERDDSEASRLSTARMHREESEALNMQVYNATSGAWFCCNFSCFWTKTKPDARYA